MMDLSVPTIERLFFETIKEKSIQASKRKQFVKYYYN